MLFALYIEDDEAALKAIPLEEDPQAPVVKLWPKELLFVLVIAPEN